MFLYLLYANPTCFVHISWLSSGSYKFSQRVQRILQLVIIIWPKYDGAVYNKQKKHTAKLVGAEICVY